MAPNQKLCLFNALRQYLKTYDAELLVVPSVVFCAITYLVKRYTGDLIMLMLQIPGWIFLLDTLLSELLSSSPVNGVFNPEVAYTRFPYPFNIIVSCLAACALTRYTPNIYPAISGAFCMAYMLQGMLLETPRKYQTIEDEQKVFSRVLLIFFIGCSYILSLNVLANTYLASAEAQRLFKRFSIAYSFFFISIVYTCGWSGLQYQSTAALFRTPQHLLTSSEEFQLFGAFLSLMWYGGALNLNLLLWINFGNFKPFFMPANTETKQMNLAL